MSRARLLLVLPALAAAAPLPAQRVRPAAPLDTLEARAREDTLDAAAQFNLGVGYLYRERWDAADAAFQRAMAIDPRHALAHLGWSVAQDQNRGYWRRLERRGDTVIAAELQRRNAAARRAYMLDPFVDPQLQAYSNWLPREARDYLARGDYETLFQIVDTFRGAFLLKTGQRNDDSLPPALLWNHAMWAAHTGRDSLAIADVGALIRVMQAFERSASLGAVPLGIAQLRYLLAALYQRRGDRGRALDLYAEVAAEDIGAYMAKVRRAELFEQVGDWAAALRERHEAVAIEPDDPTLRRDLAVTLLNAGRAAEAESLLAGGQASGRGDVQSLYVLGRARERLGDRGGALAAYEAFIAAAPRRLAPLTGDARRRSEALRGSGPD